MKKTAEHFWSWFSDHKTKLKSLRELHPKEQKHYTFWLDWHLRFYAPGLEYILIFPKRKKKKMEFIISAKGNPEYFSTAINLVNAAPSLWNWKFTALIQPRQDYDDMEAGLDKPYIFQDITLKKSELKFIPFEYDGQKKIDMIVYLKNFTIYSHNNNLLQLVYMMIQDLLGEKSMHENINFVQLAQSSDEEEELICLYDLQCYIDDINRNQNKML